MNWLWKGENGITDLPQWVYSHLVLALKIDPDALTGLKCIRQIDFVGNSEAILIRIFDPLKASKTLQIKDFSSLDHCPELVLYEGYLDKKSGEMHLAATAGKRVSH